MKILKVMIAILAVTALAGCAAEGISTDDVALESVPVYGGVQVNSLDEFRASAVKDTGTGGDIAIGGRIEGLATASYSLCKVFTAIYRENFLWAGSPPVTIDSRWDGTLDRLAEFENYIPVVDLTEQGYGDNWCIDADQSGECEPAEMAVYHAAESCDDTANPDNCIGVLAGSPNKVANCTATVYGNVYANLIADRQDLMFLMQVENAFYTKALEPAGATIQMAEMVPNVNGYTWDELDFVMGYIEDLAVDYLQAAGGDVTVANTRFPINGSNAGDRCDAADPAVYLEDVIDGFDSVGYAFIQDIGAFANDDLTGLRLNMTYAAGGTSSHTIVGNTNDIVYIDSNGPLLQPNIAVGDNYSIQTDEGDHEFKAEFLDSNGAYVQFPTDLAHTFYDNSAIPDGQVDSFRAVSNVTAMNEPAPDGNVSCKVDWFMVGGFPLHGVAANTLGYVQAPQNYVDLDLNINLGAILCDDKEQCNWTIDDLIAP